MTKVKLTKQEVLHLAQLANLQLSEQELQKITTQLDETLSYVENLNELNTDNVQPTNHTSNQTDVFFKDGTECKRMFKQEEALANAKNKKGQYFVVGRIMEE